MRLLHVTVDQIAKQHTLFVQTFKKNQTAPLFYEAYASKSFNRNCDEASLEYPRQIKLPKDLHSLLIGDLEPSKILTLTEPPKRYRIANDGSRTDELIPVWYGNTSKCVNLRFGYKNGDSRFLSPFALGDQSVHMFLGGATGQGKSVALNNLIFNMCEEYAPWELELYLFDPKIVEFKAYAEVSKLPHVKAIGAVSDTDYVLSVLAQLEQEMKLYNSAFMNETVGTKNIKDYRKATGLAIPRKVIVIDEVQTLFKDAGKKSNVLASLIDSFARLGRNTGYHLLMASQEVSSDIPKGTLANIGLRGALGCDAAVSERIIGNAEASYYFGKKGNMIVNPNASKEGDNKSDNELYKVPFLDSTVQKAVAKEEMALAEQIGFERKLSFYDEEKSIAESEYDNYLVQFPRKRNTIYLGEPSFIKKDGSRILTIDFDMKDTENIGCIFHSIYDNIRIFKMLKANMKRAGGEYHHVVLCVNEDYEEIGKASELTTKQNFHTTTSFENNYFFQVVFSVIARRKTLLKIDNLVFDTIKTSELSDEIFYKIYSKGDTYDNTTNRSRCYYLGNLLRSDPDTRKSLNPNKYGTSMDDFNKRWEELTKILISMYDLYGCSDTKLTKYEMPPIFNWILGIDRVIGLGRDQKMNAMNMLKSALQDSTAVNVRFVIFATDIRELRALYKELRWVFFDNLNTSEQTGIGCDEDYPATINKRLAVLFDRGELKCMKFKKMLFDDEIL